MGSGGDEDRKKETVKVRELFSHFVCFFFFFFFFFFLFSFLIFLFLWHDNTLTRQSERLLQGVVFF